MIDYSDDSLEHNADGSSIPLSDEARAYYHSFLQREDVQAKPGLKKFLEDLLSGRKPKPRVKGVVDPAVLPDGFRTKTVVENK